MKKKSVITYSVFACIIYALAIIYFAFNLTSEYINGSSRTRRRFDHTAIAVQENINVIHSSYNTADQIKSLITTSFGNLNDFAYIELFENDKPIFTYKTNTLENGSSSKMLRNYTDTFRIGETEYCFTANLYNLRPASIFLYGKRSFLVILIVTIITFILIVIANLNEVQTYTEVPVEEVKADTEEEAEVEDEAAEAVEEETAVEEEKAEAVKEETKVEEEKTEAVKEETKVEEEEPAVETPVAEETPSATETPSQELPEAIYNHETGLSFEPFLETKLNNEINRSIASESDLSLFLIQLPELKKDSSVFKQICNYLIIQFQYKDLIFEYKNDSIAAIKVNSTIDEAITFADKLQSDIKNIVNDENVNCYIGITSRTIRMVSAERLLIEADEALEHAKEDKRCPIIAFRADAEKYRLANLS